MAVRLLARDFPEDGTARRAIGAATHDDLDWVAFTSLKMVGELRIDEVLMDLVRISGWPSNFTRPRYTRKPVGCGAAFTKSALVRIFGTDDHVRLRELEDRHFADTRRRIVESRRPRENADVVVVPAGPFIAGASAEQMSGAGPFQMDDTDNTWHVVDLPAFAIDRTTVTNERYARFLAEAADTTEFDHPDRLGADHTPAHWHDTRFNRAELPVVGVDWYDCWSFAKWAGGRLASEYVWEKAARGTDARMFPWGGEWDPAKVNFVERVLVDPWLSQRLDRFWDRNPGLPDGLLDLLDDGVDHVVLTHHHCDHLHYPSLRWLAERLGATPGADPSDRPDVEVLYPHSGFPMFTASGMGHLPIPQTLRRLGFHRFRAMRDGDQVDLGGISIRAIPEIAVRSCGRCRGEFPGAPPGMPRFCVRLTASGIWPAIQPPQGIIGMRDRSFPEVIGGQIERKG